MNKEFKGLLARKVIRAKQDQLESKVRQAMQGLRANKANPDQLGQLV